MDKYWRTKTTNTNNITRQYNSLAKDIATGNNHELETARILFMCVYGERDIVLALNFRAYLEAINYRRCQIQQEEFEVK